MKTVAFFNDRGGVGATTLVYHLAWMYSELGVRVVAADLDPQANLTAMFLDEDRLEELWPDGDHPASILGSVAPALRGLGDATRPHVEQVTTGLGLVVGDPGLSRFEARLAAAWSACLDGDEAAFRAESTFDRAIVQAAQGWDAALVLIDVGPNLGAINRAAMIAADFVAVPLAPDLFSLQGLRNLGPMLRDWRREWTERMQRCPAGFGDSLPAALMQPAGYVVMQHVLRAGYPVQAYRMWMARIPGVYRTEALGERGADGSRDDGHRLATLRHYRSLMPMAQEARKPMFHLRAADGALGAHIHAVRDCHRDFERLARAIAGACGIAL